MVDVLMLASLGDTNLDELLALSQEYDVVRKERVQSFFSDRTIYDATAFTQTNAGGDEAAYLGHVIVGPNGRLGFNPSVLLAGEVGEASFHDFFAGEIAARHDPRTTLVSLLSGDDVVVGNGSAEVYGLGGDDVLLGSGFGSAPGERADIFGGDGDDVLFAAQAGGLNGGAGTDTFVINVRYTDNENWYMRDFEHGIDHIRLDRNLYADVGGRITKDSVHVGSVAADAEDRIIIEKYGSLPKGWLIYIDPDGTGANAQQFVGFVGSTAAPTFRDFGLIDAAKLMPDISDLFHKGAPLQGASGTDHAEAHAALAHDLAPPSHHGLIELV